MAANPERKLHLIQDLEEVDQEGSDFEENNEEDVEKKEYVKKEYYARPYESDGITEASVNALIIKNSR